MSGLWTPDGEHEVPTGDEVPGDDGFPDDGFPDDGFPDDRVGDVQAELADVRARLAEVPAEVVVLNHAMGLYELAAIHLSAVPPRLSDAVLAIDGFACLVEGLGDRLGPDVATLRDALSQIRIAFVQIKGSVGEPA